LILQRENVQAEDRKSDQTILDMTVMKSHLMDYRKSLKTSKANRSPPFSLLSPHPFHNFFFVFAVSRSSVYPLSNSTSAQYVTCNLKLDAEKSKLAGLAQQIGPIFSHSLLRLVKGTTKPSTCQRRV
jgi:hypothetical protein